MSESPNTGQTVFLVDNDEAVRDALGMLLRASGLRVQAFESAQAFLKHYQPDQSGCLILDIRMPGMSGLELQDELRNRKHEIPIIFLTGHGDIPMAVRALKKGAFDFIEKPHDEQRLVITACNALRKDAEQRSSAAPGASASADVSERLALLTVREREVLALILDGKQTRAIAEELNVSVKTVEFHRGRIREKLQVGSLAELFSLFIDHESKAGSPTDHYGVPI